MNWAIYHEKETILFAHGRTPEVEVSYLTREDGSELHLKRHIREEVYFSLKMERSPKVGAFESEIRAVYIMWNGARYLEVDLAALLDSLDPLRDANIEDVGQFLNTIADIFAEVAAERPHFLISNSDIDSTPLRLVFVLSLSKRWSELQSVKLPREIV